MDSLILLLILISFLILFFSGLGYLIGLAGKDKKRRSRNLKRIVCSAIVFLATLILVPNDSVRQVAISQTDYPVVEVPENQDYVEVNGNVPFFTEADLATTEPYHENGPLDPLGRATAANAVLSAELMPAEERESIEDIRPSGWKQARYAGISNGGWLYNRSHLIGHQLTGNDSPRNIITGTRHFNESMIPFENYVAAYVEAGGLFRYRVTPVFEGDNHLASGVYMEGQALDDVDFSFNIFIPNRQPGVLLNYRDGSSKGPEGPVQDESALAQAGKPLIKGNISSAGEKIYHMPGQRDYDQTVISPSKGERYFFTEEEALAAGWRPAPR